MAFFATKKHDLLEMVSNFLRAYPAAFLSDAFPFFVAKY